MERTDLENCVLGVVWRRGPCSAYAVRSEFAASLSAQWSASAGSIYPVIRRLQRDGLIEAEVRPWGRRGKQALSVSARGLEALQAWVARFDAAASSPTPDPVRTRLLFLEALESMEERAGALDAAEAETRARLAAVEAAVESRRESGSLSEQLAASGAAHQLQARLRWLAEVREAMLSLREPAR